MTSPPAVEQLTGPRAAQTAGAVLGRGFEQDPLWCWLLRGGSRPARLRQVLTALAGTADRTPGARLLCTPERTAAALWLPPGRRRPGPVESARALPGLAVGLRGGALRGLRLQAVMDRHTPREPHWYLEALAAVPEARGTGVGGPLLQPVLDRCDDEALPAYLESSNPRNWRFYERHGFVRGEPLPVPPGCPVLMPMTRQPR